MRGFFGFFWYPQTLQPGLMRYLCIDKCMIESTHGQQLAVSSLFHYFAILDDCYDVRILDRGQPMSNDDAGPTLSSFIQGLLDNLQAWAKKKIIFRMIASIHPYPAAVQEARLQID